MDIATILGVTGIIVSAGFGVWGIFIALKHRYPGKITFVKEQSIGLFDAIAKNLPELSIEYKKLPVSQNLVLLKGALLNSGKLDISPSTIEKALTVKLPEDYQWLEANIIGTSDNVNATIKIYSGNELHIDTGLFRCGEFIRFQALAEVPVDDSDKSLDHRELGDVLESAILFLHRIANTGKVIKAEIEAIDRKKLIRKILVPTLAGVLGSIAIATSYYLGDEKVQLVYSYEISENKYVDVSIRPKASGEIKVKGLNDEVDETVSASEFFKRTSGNPIIKEDEKRLYFIIIAVVAYLLLPLFMSLPAYYNYRRNKILINTLEIENVSPNNAINSDS